jgi:hypothetical protein
MESRRTLAVLGAVLVALGALYFVTSHKREHLATNGGFVKLVDGKMSTDDIFGIEAWKGTAKDKGVAMAKRGDAWVVTSRYDAPANLNKIRSLLSNLEGLEGEVRSDSPAVLADYGLADSTGIHLVLKKESGEERLHLLLGKHSGSGAFVRTEGSNKAVLASTNLLGDFGIWGDSPSDPDPKQWLDLEVYKVNRDDVHTITTTAGKTTIEMTKEFSKPPTPPPAPATKDSTAVAATTPPAPTTYEWRVEKPSNFLALKTRGDAILSSLSSIRARDLADPQLTPEQTGLTTNADRVLVTVASGSTDTLLFGNKVPGDETQLYFKVAGKDRTWILPSYITQNIFKKTDELKPK